MRVIASITAAAIALSGCATVNSTPANPQVAASERQQASQQHPQLLAQFGGAYTGPEAGYVVRVGQKIASAAGLPGQCTFSVVNTDVVNAFAVPGCYIYITRGLLGLMNSEAELASVLGHEVGHVVADHSARRQNASIFSTLGSVLVGVLTGSGDLAQMAGQAAQLYTLRYSRSQEHESDDLGVRYLVKAGYDPYAAADMLESLGAQDQLQTRLRGRDEASAIPEWARTHPLTTERVSRASAQARGTGIAPGALSDGKAAFLTEVDGLLYGDDPEQGFVEGRTFAHPKLKLAFDAPSGFSLTNSTQAVLIEGPNGLRAQFSGGKLGAGGIDGYAARTLQQIVGQAQAEVGSVQRTTINGLETAILPARAATQSGAVDVTIVAYRFAADTAYHFVTIAPAGQEQAFEPLIRSVRRLSDREAAALRPRRIEVVTVRAGDTVTTLASRMAYTDYRLERFLVLNDRAQSDPLRPGERVKLVVHSRS